MILVDVNLLIYAHVRQMPQHEPANRWLDTALNGPAPVGLPWHSLLGFLRIVTNPRAFEVAEDPMAAWAVVQQWLAVPTVWTPGPTDRHSDVLDTLVRRVRPAGSAVPDSHLAALAIEHGLTLMTADRGFARFPGLRWENPLDPEG